MPFCFRFRVLNARYTTTEATNSLHKQIIDQQTLLAVTNVAAIKSFIILNLFTGLASPSKVRYITLMADAVRTKYVQLIERCRVSAQSRLGGVKW